MAVAAMTVMDDRPTCDHCQQRLERDDNGYWVGPDGTSDCPVDVGGGHTVDGDVR